MGYPLNTEGLVAAESAPAEPLTEDVESGGDLDVDAAGVEAAPTPSTAAVDAMATRIHGGPERGAEKGAEGASEGGVETG